MLLNDFVFLAFTGLIVTLKTLHFQILRFFDTFSVDFRNLFPCAQSPGGP